MGAKDNILARLRKGSEPFTHTPAVTERYVMVPMDEIDLLERFIQQATALSAIVHQPKDENSAIKAILEIIGEDETILAWDFEHIPVSGLEDSLNSKNIVVADSRDGQVRVGITGAEAGFAATGSLLMSAKDGKPRSVSLLPYTHIAVIKKEQILPHFDAWLEQEAQDKQEFRKVGNHVVITGASRTADIGMELVLGAHGPAVLHIIIL